MAYPGLTFALFVVAAIGAAIYAISGLNNTERPLEYNNPDRRRRRRRSNYDIPGPKTQEPSGSKTRAGELCVICHEKLQVNIILTECGHLYHQHCLSQWVNQQKSCPICRSTMSNDVVQTLTQNTQRI